MACTQQETTEDILEKKEERKAEIKKEEAGSLRKKLNIKTNGDIYNKVRNAVIEPIHAILILSFFENRSVITIRIGAIPTGFIRVNNVVRQSMKNSNSE